MNCPNCKNHINIEKLKLRNGEIPCNIYNCEKDAKYVVNDYGDINNMCWEHLRERHRYFEEKGEPNGDPNVKVILTIKT